MLLRRALKNSLNVILPAEHNYISKTSLFSLSDLADTPWERAGVDYQVSCLHGRFHRANLELAVGVGAAYFTVLRDPLDMFVSLWDYYGYEKWLATDLQAAVIDGKM